MAPCLAASGSVVSVPLIAAAVLAVAAGATLYFAIRSRRKNTSRTTTLTIVLLGALLAVGAPPTVAHAEGTAGGCGQAAPVPTSSTATSAPAQSPAVSPTPPSTGATPPPGECAPQHLTDTIESWTGVRSEIGTYLDSSELTDPTLVAALPPGSYDGHLRWVSADGATVIFDGTVQFLAYTEPYSDSGRYVLIRPGQPGWILGPATPEWPASDPVSSVTLTLPLVDASTSCAIDAAIAGPAQFTQPQPAPSGTPSSTAEPEPQPSEAPTGDG